MLYVQHACMHTCSHKCKQTRACVRTHIPKSDCCWAIITNTLSISYYITGNLFTNTYFKIHSASKILSSTINRTVDDRLIQPCFNVRTVLSTSGVCNLVIFIDFVFPLAVLKLGQFHSLHFAYMCHSEYTLRAVGPFFL